MAQSTKRAFLNATASHNNNRQWNANESFVSPFDRRIALASIDDLTNRDERWTRLHSTGQRPALWKQIGENACQFVAPHKFSTANVTALVTMAVTVVLTSARSPAAYWPAQNELKMTMKRR